ncbi:hypothetical protein [Streptomyces bungoensis]|uniref:hypothetical protein n=1 Tax=Streptomyces bungoensis TaxID=285568 RepID=UPI003434127C
MADNLFADRDGPRLSGLRQGTVGVVAAATIMNRSRTFLAGRIINSTCSGVKHSIPGSVVANLSVLS